MGRPPFPVLVLSACLAAGCRADSSGPAGGRGSLTASWIGADTGKLSGRPRAVFCAGGNHLELLLSRDDVGLGLAVYPTAGLATGVYQGFDPSADTTVERPGVTAAARWFTEREISAYQSDRGTLTLTQKGEGYSGAFAIHLRKLGADTDTILLTGRFQGVVPAPCAADSVSPPEPAE